MSTIFKIKPLLFLLASVCILVYACKKEDDTSNTIQLLSFGPSPVLRGGELKFIGENLDKVSAIVLSNNVEVSTFITKTPTQLVIEVPQATVEGKVVLKTPQGDITAKTILKISEPIAITAFSPVALRPGAVLTIEGTYLNLIKEVVFANKKAVASTDFVSQTQTKIEVTVPAEAQTGLITLSNGASEPILVESKDPVTVTLPAITAISPTPVKAGAELTIEGTDLDLTQEIAFTGGAKTSTFVSKDAVKIVVAVPADAKDGAIKLGVASLVQVSSTQEVVMKLPTIASVSPNPAKNGQSVTVTGTDLDLITKATFGSDKVGQIQNPSATQITVTVPIDATDGAIVFATAAAKSVSSAVLTLVAPSIASIAPLSLQVNNEITITGSNLDLVATVKFSGGKEAVPSSATDTEVKVIVPVGTTSGAITIVAKNGTEVVSNDALDIQASTSAVVTNMPTSAKPGEMITIEGQNLAGVSEVVFPINVVGTMFGLKTDMMIQVWIPLNVKTGIGKIKLITGPGEFIETPEINIQGVDPVVDPSLVFFNFDNLGFWWNDTGAPENDPSLSLDGSNYLRVNKTCSGWTGFFWRNGGDNFPGGTIGTNVADYVLKFDINVLDPITGGEFAWRLKGGSGDFWYYWKPWAASGSYTTNGWITITIPVTDFYAGAAQIADLSTITEDFGCAFNNGDSPVNACIDNVRFEHK